LPLCEVAPCSAKPRCLGRSRELVEGVEPGRTVEGYCGVIFPGVAEEATIQRKSKKIKIRLDIGLFRVIFVTNVTHRE